MSISHPGLAEIDADPRSVRSAMQKSDERGAAEDDRACPNHSLRGGSFNSLWKANVHQPQLGFGHDPLQAWLSQTALRSHVAECVRGASVTSCIVFECLYQTDDDTVYSTSP